MKKLPSYPRGRAKTAAASVSAAALMLGASQAATIGFNFQWAYCGYNSLLIAPGVAVTALAFGLDTGQWVNLDPMCVGSTVLYGIPEPYTSMQWVAIPNGSVRVTWSAANAGLSLLGGYNTGGICVTCGPPPGNQQVYWGFLSDGIGLNGQPGYWVDVVGLKSLFTNSPFVVQLVGSFSATSDSVQSLTNAFIIDPTTSATQSVSYPNIPPSAGADSGGLSTPSGRLETDALRIVGNHAQRGVGPPSFYRASTLAGFILTDQPVVTMSPQPAVATAGDTVLLRAVAIGVPPLACQWRKDGVPIVGATDLLYGATNIQTGGDFDLVVTNSYGATTSQVATVTVNGLSIAPSALVLDSKPGGLPRYGANFGATWLASSQDNAGTNRLGVMQFSAATAAQIVLPTAGTTNLDFPQGTITFWMRSAGTVTNNGSQGAMLFDRVVGGVDVFGDPSWTGLAVVQADAGALMLYGYNPFPSRQSVSDNKWHHVALVFDQTGNGPVDLYIDGLLDSSAQDYAWTWPASKEIELGGSRDPQWRAYNGLLDDFRLYSRKLTLTEIDTIVRTDALVDTNALAVRWNFDAPPVPGVSVTWPANSAVLQSAATATGIYTDVPSVASPYYLEPPPGVQFYRFRRSPPVVINTNPFDM